MKSLTKPTNPIFPALENAARAAWSGGMSFTQRALAESIAADLGQPPESVARALTPFLNRLAAQSIYVAQRAGHGSKTAGAGLLTSPQCLNWSTVSPAVATLRHVVEPYLEDEDVVDYRKHALRSAVRFALELPTKCLDGTLLKACERVGAAQLYALPGRVLDSALAQPNPLAKQTAMNHRSAIRAAMRYAAERRLVPMVFPQIWNDDAWMRDKERFFPLNPTGPTEPRLMSWRCAWKVFADSFATLYPQLPNELSSLTREIAETVIRRMQLHDGHYSQGYLARGALRYIASAFSVGPFAAPAAADAFLVDTPSGRKPALYLRGPVGEGGDGNWDTFFSILKHNGLPEEMNEFLRWYREYVTISSVDIIGDTKFPPRRERMRLDENTLSERLTAVRAFLGVAIHNLGSDSKGQPLGMSLLPESLTPEEVFAFRFVVIQKALIAWWLARAAVLPDGEKGKSTSGALRQMVINVGMIALALYERLRHERQLRIATSMTPKGLSRVDWNSEEDATKTPAEAAAWNAYRQAGRMADALNGGGSGRKGSKRAKRTNDFKDLRRIIKNTPPAYWIKLLQSLIAQMREAKRLRKDSGFRYHNIVADAMQLGLLISTGCRIEEVCHMRLDVQARDLRTKRIIRLRAIDRKNGKDHEVLVQSEYVPDDLLGEYLDRTRPWFMKGMPATPSHGVRPRKQARKVPARKRGVVDPHEWLLLSTTGRAFGCVGEQADGTGRMKTAFKRRCAQAGQRFKVQMATLARSLDMELPGTMYEFGPHAVRGACGYGVFLMYGDHGVVMAAHYLGDEEATVREAYSSINGLHVDSSCLAAVRTGPQLNTGRHVSGATESVHTSRLHSLVDAFAAGTIDAASYMRQAAVIVDGCGHGALAA